MDIYEGQCPEGRCVRIGVEGDRIASVVTIAARDDLPHVLPVLVDLQQNGALGTYYNQLEAQGIDRLDAIARHLRQHGVGRCMLTLTTYDPEGLRRTASLIGDRLSEDADLASLFFGIFHEGVYISPEDGWRGAHAKQWVESPDYDRFKEVDDRTGNRIRQVNVAPEEPGGLAFVERAVEDGKIVSLGHCGPDADCVREAVARGATRVTHFGNGVPPMIHRFQNPFWAFLSEPKLKLGLICDGFHLPQDLVRTALACKGRDGCLVVSDASGYSGCPPGDYSTFGDRDVVIEPDGFLHMKDSELLAGAWFQQDRCVEVLARHMSFLDAWAQCSRIPAEASGIRLPEIDVGEEASFVLARWDDGLVIEQSVHLGKSYFLGGSGRGESIQDREKRLREMTTIPEREVTTRMGLVGCGHRGVAGFIGSLKTIGKAEQVMALCDTNATRMAVAWEFLGHLGCRRTTDLASFLGGDDFDTVIIATPDHTHADLAEACFAAGKAVVCEKPMATTLADCRRIIEAKGDRECRIAFNFRYNRVVKETKEIIASGAIGRVLSVEAHDIVGWPHGADYFRRWHRFRAKSGGLLIHKSTHTFDAINWWLDDVPERVFASGSRAFYLAERQKGERCSSCVAGETCPFYVDLRENVEGQDAPFKHFYRRMYLEAEPDDGYIRDACVFDATSDIFDTYHVNAVYRGGATLAYTAVFYAPYEDRVFALQGDRGRIEVSRQRREIRVCFGPEKRDEVRRVIEREPGGHDGADVRLARALFGEVPDDIANATAEAAYWSVALADSANRSIRSGRQVIVPSLDDGASS